MAAEQRWFYDRIVSGGDADGSICIFCKQKIIDEMQPAHWVFKAVEDDQDTDYVTEDGYAHYACHQSRLAGERKSAFELPPVPDIPRHTS